MDMVDTPIAPSKVESYKQSYLKARKAILDKMPIWKRREILEMESSGNKDNRYYNEFVKDVIALAEDS